MNFPAPAPGVSTSTRTLTVDGRTYVADNVPTSWTDAELRDHVRRALAVAQEPQRAIGVGVGLAPNASGNAIADAQRRLQQRGDMPEGLRRVASTGGFR